MGYTIPTIEPTTHEAGTSMIFTRSWSDYPSDTWTLTYTLRNSTAAPVNITATADGTGHKVEEAYATTANWTPGTYKMLGYVTSATERHKVYENEIVITVDANAEDNYDYRTYARRMLDLLETQLQSGIIRDHQSYSINGRSFTVRSTADLLEAYNYFKAQVAQEESKGRNRKVLGRFVSPR